jgi:aryl-alcohol dehydrogenase-like predicted oxidoreductase
MLKLTELALGTAQLGMDYGRVVREVSPDDAECRALLDAAWAAGFRTLDTALAYGTAHARVAAWARDRGLSPTVIMKLAGPDNRDVDLDRHFADGIATAARGLGGLRIQVLMLHRAAEARDPAIVAALRRQAAAAEIPSWGVSVYTPDDFALASELHGIGAIEVPVNAMDNRLARTGQLARAAARGIAVLARSPFLQGTLLLDPEMVPDTMPILRRTVETFARVASMHGVSAGALALAAVRAEPGVASIVVGAARSAQIVEIASWAAAPVGADALAAIRAAAVHAQPEALDPRFWPAA